MESNSSTEDLQGYRLLRKVISGRVMNKIHILMWDILVKATQPHFISNSSMPTWPATYLTYSPYITQTRNYTEKSLTLHCNFYPENSLPLTRKARYHSPTPKGATVNAQSTSDRSLNKTCMEKCVSELWQLAQQILAIAFDRMCSSNYFFSKFLYLIQCMWWWEWLLEQWCASVHRCSTFVMSHEPCG